MKVVTFGELMVRLQPFNYERFVPIIRRWIILSMIMV